MSVFRLLAVSLLCGVMMSNKEKLVERLVSFGIFKNVNEANKYTIKELEDIETQFWRKQYQIVHNEPVVKPAYKPYARSYDEMFGGKFKYHPWVVVGVIVFVCGVIATVRVLGVGESQKSHA